MLLLFVFVVVVVCLFVFVLLFSRNSANCGLETFVDDIRAATCENVPSDMCTLRRQFV